jgi:hypothetical protein
MPTAKPAKPAKPAKTEKPATIAGLISQRWTREAIFRARLARLART